MSKFLERLTWCRRVFNVKIGGRYWMFDWTPACLLFGVMRTQCTNDVPILSFYFGPFGVLTTMGEGVQEREHDHRTEKAWSEYQRQRRECHEWDWGRNQNIRTECGA